MTADQLRELADELHSEFYDAIQKAVVYLRACADAMESGPQPVRVADKLPADRIEAIAHRAATFYRHDEVRGHEYMFKRRELLDFAARLLAEATPQRWKLVPEEPTQEMLEAAFDATRNDQIDWMRRHYRAMLAAAPTPPVAMPAHTAPSPPPECKTETERRAFAFGWWKAIEAQSASEEAKQTADAIAGFVTGDAAETAKNPPALRLPEPMTDAELRRLSIAADWRDIPLSAFARYIEAEVLRRVKEANK